MDESTTPRAIRPASDKQVDYIKTLRKRLFKVFGSQTPEEFMQEKADRSLSIVSATILISSMKRMLEDGTPPVRDESVRQAPKSEGSGYEEEPSEPDPVRESYISISQEPLPDPGPTEYWGWSWTCSHPLHSDPIKGDVQPRTAAFLAATAHWGKFHLPKD